MLLFSLPDYRVGRGDERTGVPAACFTFRYGSFASAGADTGGLRGLKACSKA